MCGMGHADKLTMKLQNKHQCRSISERGTYKKMSRPCKNEAKKSQEEGVKDW